MTVKTIGVNVTGYNEVKRLTTEVNTLKSSLIDVSNVSKGIGKNFQSLFSSFDTKKAQKGADNLNRLIKNTQKQTDDLQKNLKNIDNGVSFVKTLTALKEFGSSIEGLIGKVKQLSLEMARLGGVSPAEKLLGGFKSLNSELSKFPLAVARTVGTGLTSSISSAINFAQTQARVALSSIRKEAEELGDSIELYRTNLRALGVDDKVINRDAKQLGDYGRSTVYDAGNLLKVASTLRAFGREDSVDLTKSLAGLTAMTRNPNESIEHVLQQLQDTLASGKVYQADLRIMRQWFNAQGQAKVNEKLLEIARSKGYDSVVSATRSGDISSEELLSVIQEVGNELQSLATTIATPRQAVDNLRESLANALAYDGYDEDGNIIEAPLKKLYNSVAQLTQGVTNVINTDRFANNLKRFGDSVSQTIDRVKGYANQWNDWYGGAFLDSFENFWSTFYSIVSSGQYGDIPNRFTEEMLNLGAMMGERLGSFTQSFIRNSGNYINSLTRAFGELGRSALLEGVNEIIDVYDTILNVSVDTGALRLLGDSVYLFFKNVNDILTLPSVLEGGQEIVESLRFYFDELIQFVRYLTRETTLVKNSLGVVKDLIDFFTDVLSEFRKVDSNTYNRAFDNVRKAIKKLLDGLATVYKELIGGAIRFLGSDAGDRVLNRLVDIVLNINKAVGNFVKNVGHGDYEKGFETISNFFLTLLELKTSVLQIAGNFPRSFVAGAVILSVVKHAVNLFSALKSIGELFKSFKQVKFMSAEDIRNYYNPKPQAARSENGFKVDRKAFNKHVPKETRHYTAPTQEVVVDSPKAYRFNRQSTQDLQKSFDSLEKTSKSLVENSKTIDQGSSELLSSVRSSGSKIRGAMSASVNKIRDFSKSPMFKQGAMALGGFALHGLNGVIQGSSLSDNVKGTAGFLSSIGEGALLGGSIGGLWGAVGGGAVGLTLGALNLVNAKKQAEEEAKLSTKDLAEQIRYEIEQRGQITRDIMRSYALSLEQGSTFNNLLATSQYIQNLASNANSTIEQQMQNLGLNFKAVPDSINQSFVELNGKLVSWQELKDQTGIEDDSVLLGYLQQLSVSVGQSKLKLFGSDGTLLAEVNNFTAEQETRNQEQISTFKSTLEKLGASTASLGEVSLAKISKFNQEIENVLKGDYNTKEENKTAILEAIGGINADLKNKLVNEPIENLRNIAKDLLDQGIKAERGASEEKSALMEEITKNLLEAEKLTEDEIKNRVKELSSKTVEELREELTKSQSENVKSTAKKGDGKKLFDVKELEDKANQIDEAIKKSAGERAKQTYKDIVDELNANGLDLGKELDITKKGSNGVGLGAGGSAFKSVMEELGIVDEKLQTAIIERMKKTGESLGEALNSVKENEGLSEGAVEAVKLEANNYVQSIIKMYEEGKISLSEAKTLIEQSGADVTNIDLTSLSEKGKEVVRSLEKTRDNSKNKLSDIAKKSNVEVDSVDLTSLNNAKADLQASLQASADNAAREIQNIKASVDNTRTQVSTQPTKKESKRKESGGLVTPFYRATGGVVWKPRGTDTVPTMLTEGEFVLRKRVVDSLGLGFVRRLNAYGKGALETSQGKTVINNYYNTNNAKVTQNVNNRSEYLNGMSNLDKLMRYV